MMVYSGLIFLENPDSRELVGLPIEKQSMPALCPLLAQEETTRLIWAGWWLTLLIAAILAVLVGWLLARSYRIRYHRMAAGGPTPDRRDAWAESAKRLHPDDPTDPDAQAGPIPPSKPDPRWQS